jgi:hypothetical protein
MSRRQMLRLERGVDLDQGRGFDGWPMSYAAAK